MLTRCKKQQEGRSEHVKMLQICWSPGLRPDPAGGERSLDHLAGGEGARCPFPKNRTPLSALRASNFGPTGVRLRPYGPRPTVLPHFKPWIRPWGPHVRYCWTGAPRSLLRHWLTDQFKVTLLTHFGITGKPTRDCVLLC